MDYREGIITKWGQGLTGNGDTVPPPYEDPSINYARASRKPETEFGVADGVMVGWVSAESRNLD